MSGFLAVLRRDIGLARAESGGALLAVQFFALGILLFPLGLGPEPGLLSRLGGGLLAVMALLATRDDIAQDKIAFHGLSYGAVRAPFILAVEKRFATAMILSAGIPQANLPPEITMEHYLPRVTLPTLFMTGRDDFSYHYESSQIPLFRNLGTPAQQKKHVIFAGGHLPTGYSELQREVISWLDRTLGVP